MGDYAATSDIKAKLPNRTIDGSSKPTATEVDQWITEVEAEINSELLAAGVTNGSKVTSPARAVELLKRYTAFGVTAQIKKAYVAGHDLDDPDVGDADLEQYRNFIERIRTNPHWVAASLGITLGGTSGGRIRSYATDNDDDKSIGAGDFDPSFTRDTKF